MKKRVVAASVLTILLWVSVLGLVSYRIDTVIADNAQWSAQQKEGFDHAMSRKAGEICGGGTVFIWWLAFLDKYNAMIRRRREARKKAARN